MGTAKQIERTTLQVGGARQVRRVARPELRTRCSRTRTKEEELRAQLKDAMPDILKATIDKARTGSLVHTKWLWGVADQVKDEGMAASRSLAQMLVEELAECSREARAKREV